jgi:hypothetical protein
MRTINFLGALHHKNVEGANLMRKHFNIEFNGSSKDVVVHCSGWHSPIGNVDLYGPQIDFRLASQIIGYPVNFLSEWNANMAKKINPNCIAITLPFPVNTEKFKPSEKTGLPIVYFKRREINLLNEVISVMREKYSEFVLFSYEESYKEIDYINACSSAPFCVWVGAHESQGFALQECLSANTPIMVIDINSMHDEISLNGSRYWDESWKNYSATSCPYFDDRCGLITTQSNWKTDFDLFIDKLSSYEPRKFIEETLSYNVISKLWMNKINEYERKI